MPYASLGRPWGSGLALLSGLLACALPCSHAADVHRQAVELQPGGQILIRAELHKPHGDSALVSSAVTSGGQLDQPDADSSGLSIARTSGGVPRRPLADSLPANAVVTGGAAEASPSLPGEAASAVGENSAEVARASEASLAEEQDEFFPGIIGDVAYKAMDMLYGTTGIIEGDYPYGCICGDDGVCEKDDKKTLCKGRAGSGNGARRAAGVTMGSVVAALLGIVACA